MLKFGCLNRVMVVLVMTGYEFGLCFVTDAWLEVVQVMVFLKVEAGYWCLIGCVWRLFNEKGFLVFEVVYFQCVSFFSLLYDFLSVCSLLVFWLGKKIYIDLLAV